MRAAEFKKMIQMIVREELRRALPALIERVVTERYLDRLVEERVRQSRRGLAEQLIDDVQDDPDEDVPHALANDDRGIYHDSFFARNSDKERTTSEVVRRVMARQPKPADKPRLPEAFQPQNNPLSFVFEGVKPIPADAGPGEADVAGPGIPIDKVAEATGVDFEQIAMRAKMVQGIAAAKAGPPVDPAQKLAEIEARRKMLDSVPASSPAARRI
jgi:hypothetical protein